MANVKDIGEAARGIATLPVVTLLFLIVVGQLLLQWQADNRDFAEKQDLNRQLTEIFKQEYEEAKVQTAEMQRFADAMEKIAIATEQEQKDSSQMLVVWGELKKAIVENQRLTQQLLNK